MAEAACIHDNMTSSEESETKLTSVRFIAPVTALIAFNLIVIVGNSLVIAAVFTYRKLRTVTNTFIVSLAVSDLLLGAVVLPFSSANEVLGWWPFGRLWCSAWLAIDVWVCTASILNLCAISLDRYLAISRPFRYPVLMSPTRAKVAVAVVWTLALAICVPPLLGWKDAKAPNVSPTTMTGNLNDFNTSYDPEHTAISTTGVSDSDEVMDTESIGNWSINANYWTLANDHTYDYQSSVERTAVIFSGVHRQRTTRSSIQTYIDTTTQSSGRRRISNYMPYKRDNDLAHEFATTSTVDDVAQRRRPGRKTRQVDCRGEVGCTNIPSSAKHSRSTDWNLVSALPVDVFQSTASANSCRGASITEHPVCALTSEPGYIIYSACGSFWIPMLVMVSFYLKIYRTAVKATTALSSGVLTKKTGRITSSSDVTAVNLRVHRGGGGGGGGTRTSGGNWIPPSNRLSDGCESLNYRSSQCGSNVDEDCDSATGSHQRATYGPSTPEAGCFRRESRHGSSSDRNSTITAANVRNETSRDRMTNGANDSSWHKSSSSNRNSLEVTNSAAESTYRRAAETNAGVAPTRRRRVLAKLSSNSNIDDMSKADGSDDGVESLLRSTLTPVFEHCSASPLRSGGNCDDVELVDATQVQGRRGFVHIRTQLRRLNREKKAAKTVGVIVGCFVLCWTPFFTVYVLGVFCADCTPPIAFVIFFWLGYCNSAINPFVYALCSKDFRFAFRRLLRCGAGPRRYGSNSTLAVLINGLRTPVSRRASQSGVSAAVQFSAVNRR